MCLPKKFWQNILILVCVIVIFIGGYYFRMWYNESVNYRVVSVLDAEKVTSAITDRWELQLTNRVSGQVRIYEKKVLDAIFYQYSARKKFTQENH